MFDSFKLFKENISKSSELIVLFDYTNQNLQSMNFDDLLRAHLVYSVSAFDKFMHDIVRVGMLEIFMNMRPSTSKYLKESIPIEVHNQITSSSSSLPPEIHFENEITRKLSFLSFQDPDKVADGLSYIWNEQHKWQRISDSMGLDMHTAKTTLKTIVARRNQIVHEADIDVSIGQKYSIGKNDVIDACSFLTSCGEKIYQNVKL